MGTAAVTITITPWPLWHPDAEHIRGDGPEGLTIGPRSQTVEMAFSPCALISTTSPELLRAFGDAMHRWADLLAGELARPPLGQTELLA